MKAVALFSFAVAVLLAMVTWSVVGRASEETGAGASPVVTSFEEAPGTPELPREAALSLAAGYTGLAPETVVSARYGLVTDTSIPFFEVAQRPAWEVVFGGVNISAEMGEGSREQNPNISMLTVLIDASTKALLKVSSPRPAADGLTEGPGSRITEIGKIGLTLKGTAATPSITFKRALEIAGRRRTGIVTEAVEVIGYFGLLTDSVRVHKNIKDTPCWVLFFGGINQPVPSGPYGGLGAGPATEAMIVLNAESGRRYRTLLRSPAV